MNILALINDNSNVEINFKIMFHPIYVSKNRSIIIPPFSFDILIWNI